MQEELEKTMKGILERIKQTQDANDVMKLSQAVYNLAQAAGIYKVME